MATINQPIDDMNNQAEKEKKLQELKQQLEKSKKLGSDDSEKLKSM